MMRRLVASGGGSLTDDLEPVASGRLLLAAAGLVVMTSVPLLGPSGRGWTVLAIVGVAMLIVLAGSLLIDWTRMPPRATLVFPAMVSVALVAISLGSPGLVAPLTGVLTFCFAYIGLTQPPGTGLFAVPVAALTLLIANGGWSRPVSVRLVIATSVWVLLAELLARLTRRQSELAAALRSAAHTDALTGVANRRDLELHLAHTGAGDSIVICDLDYFKRLNDTQGHSAGDRVLADFGGMLRLVLRETDYAARYGGEEFVLVLAGTTVDEAQHLLNRLHETWSTLQAQITFSAGVATCSGDRTPSATLSAADQALYRAKESGRNTDRAETVEPMEPSALRGRDSTAIDHEYRPADGRRPVGHEEGQQLGDRLR